MHAKTRQYASTSLLSMNIEHIIPTNRMSFGFGTATFSIKIKNKLQVISCIHLEEQTKGI
jgi:hypothetical protein